MERPGKNVACVSGRGLSRRYHFGLSEHQRGRVFGPVWRIAVLAQQSLDGGAQLGADLLLDRPVRFGVAAHNFDELVRDGLEGVVAEVDDGRVVGANRVVEGHGYC